MFFFFSSRRRHTRLVSDWSSDVCSSDLRARHSRGAGSPAAAVPDGGDVRPRRTGDGCGQPAGPPGPGSVGRPDRRTAGLVERHGSAPGDRGMSGGTNLEEGEGAAGHRAAARRPIRLGLRQNAAQFTLLVAVNALVGGMLGQERTVLPLLAERQFGLTAHTAVLTYILAFGMAKAHQLLGWRVV